MALFKLSVINDALIATGNNPVNVAEDGSNEWIVGSNAYERALRAVMAAKQWKFDTAIADLTRVGTSNYPRTADMYERPADCLRIENVWDKLLAATYFPTPGVGMSFDNLRVPPLEYRIIGNHIHCTASSGGVTMLYTKTPAESDPATAGFVEALTLKVESIIARGLNEDQEAGLKLHKAAGDYAKEAAFQEDAQEPRRAAFRSSLLERRRTRRGNLWTFR